MRKAIVTALTAATLILTAGNASAEPTVAGCAGAADLIADRIEAGQPVSSDLTWRGAPSIVSDCNDVLAAAYDGPETREGFVSWVRAELV